MWPFSVRLMRDLSLYMLFSGFWENLEKPIIGLAPMDGVTDAAFRYMVCKYGKPSLTITEFTNVEGLARGATKMLTAFLYNEIERPVVGQIYGVEVDSYYKAAVMLCALGLDGIDINMGCPDKGIERQEAGAAHIKDWCQAQAVIRAAQEGAGDIPVSVKTRIGFNKIEFKEWLPKLLECNIPVLTVHLRTRKEMSKVPAHWELMPEIVKLVRDKTGEVKSGGTIILGNGDVVDTDDGRRKCEKTGCDGVMIGKGIFGTPWLFNEKRITNNDLPAQAGERLRILVEHTKLFEEKLGDIKSFAIMKKHFKAYVNGFEGAKELRAELMEANNATEVEEKGRKFLKFSP